MESAKKKQDFNGSTNQDIKRNFVQREVHCHVGSLIDKILKKDSGEFWEDWENLTYEVCTNCGEDALSTDDENHGYYCESCKTHSNDYDTRYNEILEYWAVSNYLYEKLKDKGEAVCKIGFTCIWGRCTSGQAILMDAVISNICFDMEILEDQSNEWKVV